jgi:hypothetical protein
VRTTLAPVSLFHLRIAFGSRWMNSCAVLADYGSGEKLCGVDPMEKAKISMWLRRVEQHIVLPMFNHFRWGPGKDFFAEKVRTRPSWTSPRRTNPIPFPVSRAARCMRISLCPGRKHRLKF